MAEAGKAPAKRVLVRPRDAVHWALYYPPVMLFAPSEVPKENPGDPRYRAYRAAQLLAVGRVDEARTDIQEALRLDPTYADAHALQAVIFVVQNEKEKSLAAAQKAVDNDPGSATARIAMSYARQAVFDLEGALASVEEAVKLDPEDALAWARLAELQSSFGRLGKALDAAQKAVDLEPNLSRTQMVLGFAYLAQVKTADSRGAFERAIALDQADPLARLGLGLAKIRDGDLDAGGREIEIAASHDPNNSLVRSYLGKTYFEQKQIGLDEREYAIAKELDPNDPTPWFYDAIAKQTTNRPVEALHNFQKAKELNDNRAVYRSRLLLDSDEAARSAATARIYSDLGFQQRALVEGWAAVNTDPSNFSAHRFLADSYAVRPRHEVARVSELLQSQLLQPLNITSIQPRLAESNQFLISGQGPAGLSFTEFNPLFNRNRAAVQASGLLGENETRGGEGIFSGIFKRLSFSMGRSYFDTDGWRANADQKDKVSTAFAQMQLTHRTSIQAEYRYRDNERGETRLRFFEDDFRIKLEEDTTAKTARLGFHHVFSPGHDLIGNFTYQEIEETEKDVQPDFEFIPGFPVSILDLAADADRDASGAELQYLLRSECLNIVTGGGYVDIDGDTRVTADITLFPGFTPPVNVVDRKLNRDADHTNLYLYSYIKLLDNLTFTVGGSGDFFDADDNDAQERDQFNPKFGVTWSPFSGTTLRGAAFRTLKRTLVTDQTIEPTQVAGFNQFYDDFNTTDAWRFGGAIDQKFSASLYAGAEYTYRNLSVPYVDPDSGNTETVKWEEDIFRGYLFWTPHKWVSVSAEYLYEDFDRDEDFADFAKNVETHTVPLGINFFHPIGISTGLKATYIDQDGDFGRQRAPRRDFKNGDDNFWLVDAAIKYRLPKRFGIFTVGVRNLFDEDFEYYDSDPDNARIQPDRVAFVNITLEFP
ncbi:MAG: tetratricopeptide repeat protein [Desulfobacterales bacterium]|nr:tetratricopeptide repeat protein [Desulfobacterales bacterium]